MSKRLLCTILFLASLPIAAQQAATPPPATPPAAQAAAASPTTPPRRPNIPTTFTNLTVLSPTITRPELMGVMKEFTTVLKVRCTACHAVSDDLAEGDFASDEKPLKVESRKLMVLIQKTAAPVKP